MLSTLKPLLRLLPGSKPRLAAGMLSRRLLSGLASVNNAASELMRAVIHSVVRLLLPSNLFLIICLLSKGDVHDERPTSSRCVRGNLRAIMVGSHDCLKRT